jgi:deoxyhypusine synthase
VIILGGGLVKHPILNANMLLDGAERAVYINRVQEFDGSDGGARLPMVVAVIFAKA